MELRPEWPAVFGDGDLVRLDGMSTPPEAEEAESTKGSSGQDMGTDGGKQGWRAR